MVALTSGTTCMHKRKYLKPKDAEKLARKKHLRNRAYQCNVCGYWHLTALVNGKKKYT